MSTYLKGIVQEKYGEAAKTRTCGDGTSRGLLFKDELL
jgi:hypothetical protein